MKKDPYREALLEAQRIYGLTEPMSWFIRIHDEIDLKKIRSHEWLQIFGKQHRASPTQEIEKPAFLRVGEMEHEDTVLRLSTYLHEYCHFLQLASSPYYLYVNTIQQYQTFLVIQLCNELSQSKVELPLYTFIKEQAGNNSWYRDLQNKYVVPWESCQQLLAILESNKGDEKIDPLSLYFQVNELLLAFNKQLKELTSFPKKMLALLLKFRQRPKSTEVLPLISHQPGLKIVSLNQSFISHTERDENNPRFGARSVAEGAAASAQFLYFAASNNWEVETLKTLSTIASDEYLSALNRVCAHKEFNTLSRYSKFFAFYALCDIALQTPLHLFYSNHFCSKFLRSWEDLHPGTRFYRALDKIGVAGVPQVSQKEFESLFGDQASEQTRRLGGRLEIFSNRICDSLDWPRPSEMARVGSTLVSRSDDFITRLRTKANRLRVDRPGLLLIPVSPETHAALPPVGVFVGKVFRGDFTGKTKRGLDRLIENHLLYNFSRQIMKDSHVDFYQQDSIVYSWLLSSRLIERFKDLFHEVFRLDLNLVGEDYD